MTTHQPHDQADRFNPNSGWLWLGNVSTSVIHLNGEDYPAHIGKERQNISGNGGKVLQLQPRS